MRYMLYCSIYREPVGMHIEYRHEDGNLQSLLVKDLVFHHLLDGYNRTVGRSNYKTLRVVGKTTERTSEKV